MPYYNVKFLKSLSKFCSLVTPALYQSFTSSKKKKNSTCLFHILLISFSIFLYNFVIYLFRYHCAGHHHGGIPGVFNCRFTNPYTAAMTKRKKKKPTSFVPPPSVGDSHNGMPFWCRPLPTRHSHQVNFIFFSTELMYIIILTYTTKSPNNTFYLHITNYENVYNLYKYKTALTFARRVKQFV